MTKFLHERNDFKELISALSLELKIDSQLIEKDYWIMHALWGLKDLGFIFELKGGTSLSKGWKCIDRFSEDLDIFIHPQAKLNLKIGKNHIKPSQIQARRDYFDSLTKQINITGFESTSRDMIVDDEKLMRNAGLRLIYPNLFGQIEGLKDGILLEAGFDQTAPNEELLISSWLVDKALEVKLDITDNRAKNVKCYVPEYTFVEKLQTISTKFRQLEEKGEKPINFMRHYYDVFQLLKLDRVKKFIGTDEYFEHKNKRFRNSDEKDLTQNEAFIISDPKKRKTFQESFENSKGLYYKGQPDFQTIIESFKGILKNL
jgi:predicted nucleotidyltransferase component of viral defense system